MSDLDHKIRDALETEDAEFLEKLREEPSVFEMLIETYRGRRRWLAIFGSLLTFAFFGLAVFCGYESFQAESTRDLVLWAAGTLLFALFVAMLKIWVFLEMNRIVLTREIKRVELEIARLARRMGA